MPWLALLLATLSGDYVCTYGCRLTDAPPGILVLGDRASCFDEYGGRFDGELTAPDTVECFHKTGRLDSDGVTLRWSDGVIWKRRAPVQK